MQHRIATRVAAVRRDSISCILLSRGKPPTGFACCASYEVGAAAWPRGQYTG